MTKPKSNCSIEDIELIYRTCTVHASMENDFGLFCAGMAALLTNIFDKFKNEKRFASIQVNYKLMAITTIALETTFNQVEQDLNLSKKDGQDNEMVRQKIMMIVDQAKKDKAKKETKKKRRWGPTKNQ